jgi:hypothetical protein
MHGNRKQVHQLFSYHQLEFLGCGLGLEWLHGDLLDERLQGGEKGGISQLSPA